MADTDLFMECEEEELEPWQKIDDDVIEEAVEEVNANDNRFATVSVSLQSVSSPSAVSAPPPMPVTSPISSAGIQNNDPKKTVVTFIANNNASGPLVQQGRHSLFLTQSPSGPPGVGTVMTPQMLRPMHMMQNANHGTNAPVPTQPIFITAQTFYCKPSPSNNVLNRMELLKNCVRGKKIAPLFLLSLNFVAPGTQFVKPTMGVPQVFSPMTQVRSSTTMPVRPNANTYTTVIPATLTIRSTAPPVQMLQQQGKSSPSALNSATTLVTATTSSVPSATTQTTMVQSAVPPPPASSKLASPKLQVSPQYFFPFSVSYANVVTVKRSGLTGEAKDIQTLVSFVNSIPPLGPAPIIVSSASTTSQAITTPAAEQRPKGNILTTDFHESVRNYCPKCHNHYRLIDALRDHMCYCCPEFLETLKKAKPEETQIFAPSPKSVQVTTVPVATVAPAPKPAPAPVPAPPQAPPSSSQPEQADGNIDSSQGKLIMLVDDFYYGKDKGKMEQVMNEPKIPVSFRCLHCFKRLKNNIRFMNHMKHHVELDQQNGEVDTHTTCQHCYRQFSTPFLLQCHLENVHSPFESTTKCKICEWAFESEPVFLQHMKDTHKPGEMPYVCQVCDFRSSVYSEVDIHFRVVHEDTKNMLCPYCLKVFKNSNAYQQHFVRHQKKSVYHCNKCRLQFLFAKDKIEHKLQHHRTFRKPKQLEGLKPGTKVTIRASTAQPRPVPLSAVPAPQDAAQQTGPLSQPAPSEPASFNPPAQRNAAKRTVKKMTHLGKQRCLECSFDIPDFPNHFPTYVHCSLCRYSTCCSRAYANHMINNHVPRKSPKYLALFKNTSASEVKLVCNICQFVTVIGDAMAKHLIFNPSHSSSSITSTGKKASLLLQKNKTKQNWKNWALLKPSYKIQQFNAQGLLVAGAVGLVNYQSRERSQRKVRSLNGSSSKQMLDTMTGVTAEAAPESVGKPLEKSLSYEENSFTGLDQTSEEQKGESETPVKNKQLSIRKLRVALFALCCGTQQAAEHFKKPPRRIRRWLAKCQSSQDQMEEEESSSLKDGSQRAEAEMMLVEWVLMQREQQLPVNEETLFQKATKVLNTVEQGFRISYEWAVTFMLKHSLGIESRSAAANRLPKEMEENASTFIEFVQRQIHTQDIPLSMIGAMDEISIFLDTVMLCSPGMMKDAFQVTGTGDPLCDIVITILADGSLLPALVMFRGQLQQQVNVPKNIFLEVKEDGYTDDDSMELWSSRIWQKHFEAQGSKGMLVMDSLRTHLSEETLSLLNSSNTLPAVIPAGCTSKVQPVDICISQTLKNYLHKMWSEHAVEAKVSNNFVEEFLQLILNWLEAALEVVGSHPELVQQSFLVASVLPGPEGVESSIKRSTEMQEELVNLLEDGLGLSEPQGVDGETTFDDDGDQTESIGDPQQLQWLFEAESDSESFYGFDGADLEPMED
uniref:Pogo transposable element derived with ZNF domain n=1 Tax=Latimeria chalumnae TaxID=7897 RepID=H2ZZ73_LATCH